MKRKWIICFAILLGVGLIFEIAHTISVSRRLSYQGRSAQAWLGEVFTTNQSAALQAFRDMGTNALPMLVENLKSNKDSTWDKFYEAQYPKIPPSWQKYLSPPLTPGMAWSSASLILMNSRDITPIMPELARLLKRRNDPANGDTIVCFTQRLTVRDTNYIPLLIECLSETNHYVRMFAANALSRFGGLAKSAVPELRGILSDASSDGYSDPASVEAAHALACINPQTRDAAATVFRQILDTGDDSRCGQAALYLSEVDASDPTPIPRILGALQQRDPDVMMRAAIAMGNYRSGAKPWVPDLVKIIEASPPDSSESGFRQTLIRSLKMIDPEAAAKYEKK